MIRQTLRQNLERHGGAVELVKLMEECGELTQAVAKMYAAGAEGAAPTDDDVERIAEEMADVEICMEQARMIFSDLAEKEEKWIDRKVARLQVRLELEEV